MALREIPQTAKNGRSWTNSRQTAAGKLNKYAAFATLAVHCGNGFDAGFSPYQSTRLSR